MIAFQKPMIVRTSEKFDNNDINDGVPYKAYGMSIDQKVLIQGERGKMLFVPMYYLEILDDGFTEDRTAKRVSDNTDNGLLKDSEGSSTAGTKVDTGAVGAGVSSAKGRNTKPVGNPMGSGKENSTDFSINL